jgi:hypothetical protein
MHRHAVWPEHKHEQVVEVLIQQQGTHEGPAAGGRRIVVPVHKFADKFPDIGLKIPAPRDNVPVSLSRELLDEWL